MPLLTRRAVSLHCRCVEERKGQPVGLPFYVGFGVGAEAGLLGLGAEGVPDEVGAEEDVDDAAGDLEGSFGGGEVGFEACESHTGADYAH